MEDTGVKMLYLCLSKSLDMEALEQNNLPGEWVGVLEGEDALNIYYPDKDKVHWQREYHVEYTLHLQLRLKLKLKLKLTFPLALPLASVYRFGEITFLGHARSSCWQFKLS